MPEDVILFVTPNYRFGNPAFPYYWWITEATPITFSKRFINWTCYMCRTERNSHIRIRLEARRSSFQISLFSIRSHLHSFTSPHHASCKWFMGVSPPSPPNASVSPSSHPTMPLFLWGGTVRSSLYRSQRDLQLPCKVEKHIAYV